MKEKYRVSVSNKAKKKIPCDVSVRLFILYSVFLYVAICTFLVYIAFH